MSRHDDHELTAEQEAHVRRLLAEARHTEPVPDAVVARLDRVLADLAGEPAREATVVRLADRRRRAATMLVAAAASVAAVVGVGAVVSNTGGGGDAESATSADEGGAPAAAPEEDRLSGGGELSDLGEAEAQAGYGRSQRRQPFAVEAEMFARDASVLQRRALSRLASADTRSSPELDAAYLARVRNRTVCQPGSWGAGSYIAVLYDDAEGWVVLRRPQGDTQIADLFLCGSDSVVRSVTLPHP